MDLVEQHPTQNLTDAGDRWEPIYGVDVVVRGRLRDGPCDIAESLVLAINQGEIDFHTRVPSGLEKPLGDAVAVGCGGELLPKLG
jgi:hypothetical protein